MRDWTKWLPVAQLCMIMVAAAGVLGFRLSLLSWRPAVLTLAVVAGGMLLVGFASLLLIYFALRANRRGGIKGCLQAAGVSVLPLAAVLYYGMQGARVPPIHDITTDIEDPPAYEVAIRVRKPDDNSPFYPGRTAAEQQRAAYPEIVPLLLPVSPEQAFARSLEVAASLRWTVLDKDQQQGRVEAEARTLLFRFTDDIVIRVKPDPIGSRVDIRSASRAGISDLGVNAGRIRQFIQKMKEYRN